MKIDYKVLNEILKHQGRKQQWLAEKVGCSAMEMNHYFAGRRTMPKKYVSLIGLALGLPVSMFYK